MAGRRAVPILRTMVPPPCPPRPRPRSGPPTADVLRQPSADGQVLGALLLLGGVAWLLDRSGVLDLSWQTVLSILLLALGVGMVLTARRRGGPGLVVLGVVLVVALIGTSSIDVGLLNEGMATRSISVVTPADAGRSSQLGIGQLDVDLTRLQLEATAAASDAAPMKYRLGLGHLVVRLPPKETVAVRVEASVRGGKVELPDGTLRKGNDLEVVWADEDFEESAKKLTLDLGLGFGAVQVVRESG